MSGKHHFLVSNEITIPVLSVLAIGVTAFLITYVFLMSRNKNNNYDR